MKLKIENKYIDLTKVSYIGTHYDKKNFHVETELRIIVDGCFIDFFTISKKNYKNLIQEWLNLKNNNKQE